MQSYFAAVAIGLALLASSYAMAHDEKTSEWYYIDERWPTHVGALMDEVEPEAYLRQVLQKESQPIRGWSGRAGTRGFDSIVACGVAYDAHIQQRPRGTYLMLVIRSIDGRDHKLKWIPVEYRFDNEAPRYFTRRDGSPELRKEPDKFHGDDEQQDYRSSGGRPNIKDSRVLREPLVYLFANNSPHFLQRKSGGAEVRAKFKYLEAVKFPEPKEFTRHERMQIYLPWVDDCAAKPDLWFEKNDDEETVWDYHLRSWVSTGMQFMTPWIRENGWNDIRPTPSYYLRWAHLWWEHHGFTIEAQAAKLSGVKEGTTALGFIGRISYGYGIWLDKYLTLSPEVGFRGVYGAGLNMPGYGGGLNLTFEVPGTRHQHTGQRLVLEAGCDVEKHYGTKFTNGTDLRGVWSNCKFGFGLGW